MLKNDQTYFKNLVVWTPDFKGMFGQFSALSMKLLQRIFHAICNVTKNDKKC